MILFLLGCVGEDEEVGDNKDDDMEEEFKVEDVR